MLPETALGMTDWVTDLRMGPKAFFSSTLAKVSDKSCTMGLSHHFGDSMAGR